MRVEGGQGRSGKIKWTMREGMAKEGVTDESDAFGAKEDQGG